MSNDKYNDEEENTFHLLCHKLDIIFRILFLLDPRRIEGTHSTMIHKNAKMIKLYGTNNTIIPN